MLPLHTCLYYGVQISCSISIFYLHRLCDSVQDKMDFCHTFPPPHWKPKRRHFPSLALVIPVRAQQHYLYKPHIKLAQMITIRSSISMPRNSRFVCCCGLLRVPIGGCSIVYAPAQGVAQSSFPLLTTIFSFSFFLLWSFGVRRQLLHVPVHRVD